jgi:hypothetical protein
MIDKYTKLKLNSDEVGYVRYVKDDKVTHILTKKSNTDPNKMWILWSVDDEGKLKKVAQGGSPLKLEKKIDYLHKKKDDSEYEDDTI